MPKNDPGESIYTRYKSQADDQITLRILDMVNQSPQVSQRKITLQTGLAAGLVHTLMRKIINKGWVKAKQVSARRWLYYLTPEGFTEKSRLTLEYLTITISSFRDAQRLVEAQLEKCQEAGHTRLVVAGENELAHITALNLKSHDILRLAAVVGKEKVGERMAGEIILSDDEIERIEYDCVLVCSVDFFNWRPDKENKGAPVMMFDLAEGGRKK